MPRRALPSLTARRIGARIRSVREEVGGITQEKLAWAAGVTKSHLSQIESGDAVPSLGVLFAIAAELGVLAADLLFIDRGDLRCQLADAARRKDGPSLWNAADRLGLGRGK